MTSMIPLDFYGTEENNPTTSERYPCVKHFFKLDEAADGSYASGSNLKDVIDTITGGRLVGAGDGGQIYFIAGDGKKMANFGPAYFPSTGAFPSQTNYQNKSAVIMALTTRAAGWSLNFGPITVNTGSSGFNDGVNPANTTSGNLATGTTEMAMLTLDKSAAGGDGAVVSKSTASGRTIVTGTQGGISADVDLSLYALGGFDCPQEVTDIYGMLVMQFTDLPSAEELDIIALWMRDRWLAGEKVIHPMLLGRD